MHSGRRLGTNGDGRSACSDGNGKAAESVSSGPDAGAGSSSQRSRALLTEQQAVAIYSRRLNATDDGAQSSRVLAWQFGVSCPSGCSAGQGAATAFEGNWVKKGLSGGAKGGDRDR